MRKQSLLLVSISLLLFGLLGTAAVAAQWDTEKGEIAPQSVQPGEHPATGAAQQAAMDTSAPISAPSGRSGATEDQETLRKEIQALVAQWSDTVLQGGDWLHIVAHHMRDKDRVSSLPNGQAIPLHYLSETWYHLNDNREAVEVIALMRAEDGKPVQVSTFRDNIWRNLTSGEKWSGEPFTPRPDLGFGADAARAQEWGSVLSRETATLAGRPVLRFTLRDDFASPLMIEGYAQPVIGAERRACFDARSGALLLLERAFITANGKERVVERVDLITVESGIEPPAEVLAFLQQEVTP